MNANDRCNELQKQFDTLVDNLNKLDKQIQQAQVVRQQTWDEINIVKGRFNELKEFASVVDSNVATSGSEAGISGKQVQVGSSA